MTVRSWQFAVRSLVRSLAVRGQVRSLVRSLAVRSLVCSLVGGPLVVTACRGPEQRYTSLAAGAAALKQQFNADAGKTRILILPAPN